MMSFPHGHIWPSASGDLRGGTALLSGLDVYESARYILAFRCQIPSAPPYKYSGYG